MILTLLTLTMLSCGLFTLTVEFVIRAQVNRHLTPNQRIGLYELQSPSVWLGPGGLIARHKRLYPKSWLANAFSVLWLLFLATFVAVVAYAKLSGS